MRAISPPARGLQAKDTDGDLPEGIDAKTLKLMFSQATRFVALSSLLSPLLWESRALPKRSNMGLQE